MKQEILEAVKKAKEESKPRNFTQSVDVVITIKDLDVKKPENRIDEEVFLPNGRGKDVIRSSLLQTENWPFRPKKQVQIWSSPKKNWKNWEKTGKRPKRLQTSMTFSLHRQI